MVLTEEDSEAGPPRRPAPPPRHVQFRGEALCPFLLLQLGLQMRCGFSQSDMGMPDSDSEVGHTWEQQGRCCLLYTSDAADDWLVV